MPKELNAGYIRNVPEPHMSLTNLVTGKQRLRISAFTISLKHQTLPANDVGNGTQGERQSLIV